MGTEATMGSSGKLGSRGVMGGESGPSGGNGSSNEVAWRGEWCGDGVSGAISGERGANDGRRARASSIGDMIASGAGRWGAKEEGVDIDARLEVDWEPGVQPLNAIDDVSRGRDGAPRVGSTIVQFTSSTVEAIGPGWSLVRRLRLTVILMMACARRHLLTGPGMRAVGT